MAIESSILQSLRAAGEPVAINELAIATGTDTNDTGAMQKLRNTLRGMVHKRQLHSRNSLDGIMRYMLPFAAKKPEPTSNEIDVVVVRKPDAVGAHEVPAVVAMRQDDHGVVSDTTCVESVKDATLSDGLRGLHAKTVLVYHALREGEWVERATLDFRTKMDSTEVRSALIALRNRGLVIAQGKTSNMLWARSETAAAAGGDLPVPTAPIDGFEEATSIAASVEATVTAATPPRRPVQADQMEPLDSDDARRYRWLMQNATISISIGAVSMKTECSPAAPGAKLLWDGAIDAILSMAPVRVEVSA